MASLKAVVASATVTAVEENEILLHFEAGDSHELIARGKHVRPVIDQDLLDRQLAKMGKVG